MEKKLVLILVFVEFTLRVMAILLFQTTPKCLNPCFCGIYSQSPGGNVGQVLKIQSLNPCFCGIYSQSIYG